MENNPFYFHVILGPISEVRTHKQSIKQNNLFLFLLDSSLREREYSRLMFVFRVPLAPTTAARQVSSFKSAHEYGQSAASNFVVTSTDVATRWCNEKFNNNIFRQFYL